MPLIEVEDLQIDFVTKRGVIKAVEGAQPYSISVYIWLLYMVGMFYDMKSRGQGLCVVYISYRTK